MTKLLPLPLLLLLLAACDSDPLYRTGTMAPNGSNVANLNAMVADPNQLLMGVGAEDARGGASAVAVDKLLAGQPAKLLNPRDVDVQ